MTHQMSTRRTRSQSNRCNKINCKPKPNSNTRIKRPTRIRTKHKTENETGIDFLIRDGFQKDNESLLGEELFYSSKNNFTAKEECNTDLKSKLASTKKSSTSSPLPDLCIEKEKKLVEDIIRLSDSESDKLNENNPKIETPPIDAVIFNSLIQEANNTTALSKSLAKPAPTSDRKRKLLSVIHEERPLKMSDSKSHASKKLHQGHSIKSWITTGLSDDTTHMIMNAAETNLQFFEAITTVYLTQLRGPLLSNAVELYETLTSINASVQRYFKKI